MRHLDIAYEIFENLISCVACYVFRCILPLLINPRSQKSTIKSGYPEDFTRHSLSGLGKHGIFVSHKHAQTTEQYKDELQNSKFCLILRGDDPHTSRFYDALAAGCIPVIISDGFHLVVAPFAKQINYESFTITIPESMWHMGPNADIWGSLHFVFNMPSNDRVRLLRALVRHRKSLLWVHPLSDTATKVLNEIKLSCINS